MRLIINAIPLLGEESGIGNYTRHLATRLLAQPHCDVAFFYGYPSKKLLGAPQTGGIFSSLKGLARKQGMLRRIGKKILPLAYRAMNVIHPQSWDCYFEPNFVLVPGINARRSIITVHDFSCFRYPEWHPRDRVAHMSANFWPSIRSAAHIITPSQCIRHEAISRYGFDPERVTAIPLAADAAHFHPSNKNELADLRRRYDLPERFILHVGALEPRKNTINLINAHALLPMELRERFPLLFIGPPGWNNEEIMASIQRHAPHVRLIGLVPQVDLPHFYSACELFAYPSWYEGFGLPVLEAMTCGRPVLASSAGALMELSAGAAVHAPPGDVSALAAAMRNLLEDEDLRQRTAEACMRRAAQFSWETTVERHMDIFRNMAGQC